MEGWEAVAEAVIQRRVELGMRTREKLVEAAGLSRKTLGEIERAERTSYDPATLAAVERALGWGAGTIDAIARGESPLADTLQLRLARLRAVYDLLPFALQDWLISVLDIDIERAEQRSEEALAGTTRPRTAAELLEAAEDLDEDERRIMLAALEHVKDGRRYPARQSAR